MKQSTRVWGAFRNVGDSTNQGEVFEGSLVEVMTEIVGRLKAASMKERIVIGIGRNRSGAEIAILDKRVKQTKAQESANNLMSLLNGLTDDDDSEEAADKAIADPEDDYIP